MRLTPVLVMALASASLLPAVRADDPKPAETDRARVVRFLKDHVMGRTVATPKTIHKLDNDKMENELEDQVTFNNLTESARGFGFDMTTVTRATRYDLDREGKRKLPGRDLSGTEVHRFEIVERVSTKKLTGIARLLSMTTKSPDRGGAAILLTGIKVADGKLSWNETLPGYLDLIAAGGGYKPGSWDGINTLSVVDGKLELKSEYTVFNVDPDTLKRTPRGDKQTPFVSKEITPK